MTDGGMRDDAIFATSEERRQWGSRFAARVEEEAFKVFERTQVRDPGTLMHIDRISLLQFEIGIGA